MNAAKRYEIFSRFREDNPKPETELNYSSSFELLIAVILSARSVAQKRMSISVRFRV